MAKHGFTHTHVEHHSDGSHTVHHVHKNPEKDVKHAVADLEAVHQSMHDNLEGEASPEAATGPAAPGTAVSSAPMPGM